MVIAAVFFASPAALGAPAPRTPERQASPAEVIVPGGEGFVRAVLGMGPPEEDIFPGDFLPEVAAWLSQPWVIDVAGRLEDTLGELEQLEQVLAELDGRHGPEPPSLAAAGTQAYQKAEGLLDYLGLEARGAGAARELRPRGGRYERRRQLLVYLGIAAGSESERWAAGAPIEITIPEGHAGLVFGSEAWNSEVFGEPLVGSSLFRAFVEDERARAVLLGYANLDRPTRTTIFEQVGLRDLYDDEEVAEGFSRLAPYLRSRGGELTFPGNDLAAWQAILGGWRDTSELFEKLTKKDSGRPAHLWRALALLPESRAQYLLTLAHPTSEARVRWARELYGSIEIAGFGDGFKWPEDVAELFVNLSFDADDTLAWPGGARAWLAALKDDDPLDRPGELEQLWSAVAELPDDGAEADAAVVRRLLSESNPSRRGPSAIRKYLSVRAALRYQPMEAMRPVVPLLYRNYGRFGRAYGFLVIPAPLSAKTVQGFVNHLRSVDEVERPAARVETIRQLQATLLLVQQLLRNDLLPTEERGAVLQDLFDLRPERETGYGHSLAEWWRGRLVPAVAKALRNRGWSGNGRDYGSVVMVGLVGAIAPAPLELDGIAMEFGPAVALGNRLQTYVAQQQIPSLELLLQLDELAAVSIADPQRAADMIEAMLADLRNRLPANVVDGRLDKTLPVPVGRAELFRRGDELVNELRAGTATVTMAARVRLAVAAHIGDALVGLAYAMNLRDPRTFIYQEEQVAWLHQLVRRVSKDSLLRRFDPWGSTSERWVGDQRTHLINSLFGVSEIMGSWALESHMPLGESPRNAMAEGAWGATLGYLHYPTLSNEAQRRVAGRYRLATGWILAASQARDPRVLPATWSRALTDDPPTLPDLLGQLMRPRQIQRFIDAVGAGDATTALQLVSPGNRYFVGRFLEGGDRAATAESRWAIDQVIGMPVARRGDYLGLGHPPVIPYGEAGDDLADPLFYSRLLDLRVKLAVLLEEQQLPAALHARLLPEAMGTVLAAVRPRTVAVPEDFLRAIETQLTPDAIRDWVVDLAFADEIEPRDPVRGVSLASRWAIAFAERSR